MKNYLPALATLGALLAFAFTLRTAPNPAEFNVNGFAALPALVNGRVKPLDTVARTTLLNLQGRQRVTLPDGSGVPPAEWLLDMLYRPAHADHYQVFEIVHPEVLALLNLSATDGAGGKRFSAQQLAPKLAELDRQAQLADSTDSAARTPFQRAVLQLRNGVALYQQLQISAAPPNDDAFFANLAKLERVLPTAKSAKVDEASSLVAPGTRQDASSTSNPAAHASSDAAFVLEMARTFATLDQFAYLHPIPPAPGADAQSWRSVGATWTATLTSGKIDSAAGAYADLGRAWQNRDAAAFNNAVASYAAELKQSRPEIAPRIAVELRFNSAQPFYTAMMFYVVAFLCGVISWLRWPDALSRTGFGVLAVAFLIATGGIVARMWLEARPPVTNLYSSALFVGWGAVALCLVLEKIYANAIGTVAGSVIGFATLVIAHHLALGGDTMEMMRAVLDSNFWLATHVVTIAVGYSATFLAGFLAVICVLRGVLTRGLDAATAASLSRMIYGIICFATLFSFAGTILGGIWADQSWGRFWGWDPKENGALLIVLWNSIILHARWAGAVRDRGIAVLAVFGNIVTAWSWFGVNMLGVGLHSYGFMDSAFWWLVGFVATQLVIMLIAALPRESWRSAVALGTAKSAA